jgi:hypothetical protein
MRRLIGAAIVCAGVNPKRLNIVVVWMACALAVLKVGGVSAADSVDLSKPLKADKDTIALYHLDDVASGEVRDAVEGGKPGKVVQATEGRRMASRTLRKQLLIVTRDVAR